MKIQLLRTILVVLLVFFIIPLSSFAYDQYESMEVGETKTFYFPSEVTNRAGMMYAYNCSSDHINNVEVISYTNTSVTVKAVAYTQSQVHIRFDYWWYENNYGRHDTHMVHIDLNGGGGGGGNTGSDYNPSNYDIDYGSWGTITVEEGKTTTVYCQYNTPNPSKVHSILWSDYNQFSYEITSQSSSSCTIKGRVATSGGKLWCLMKYGSNSYKAYYTVVVKESTTPTLSLSANPAGGVIDIGTKVYLTASNSSADIYYTLNGSQPTTNSSRYTSSGITINESCTLMAYAKKSGYNDSPVMTWIFTIEENQTKILIDATNFPDEIFRNYLLEQDYGKDGVLTKSEISGVTELKVREMNIGSLIGIEFFTALKELDCYKNKITSLDLTANTALTSVICCENQLTDINLSKNVALTKLNCGYNSQLTLIDVSKNVNLEELIVWATNLAELDVTNNTKLIELSGSSSTITSLDLTKNTLIKKLSWRGALESLDLSRNKALTSLSCSENQITSLDLSNCTQLETLWCERNQLTSLILPNSSKLASFWMDHNRIRGNAMDLLINSLPTNKTNEPHTFRLHLSDNGYKFLFDGYSENVCTKKQVAAIKAKGWTPLWYNNGGWVEYNGGYDFVIIAKNCSREYGEDNPEFEYEVSGGELTGTPILSCWASKTYDVDTYNISVDQGTVQGSMAGITGKLTVNKAPLTVSVESCTRKEGEPNPDFILHYSGWKNNQNESVLKVKPTATTAATTNSPVGIYDIVVSGGEAINYSFNYVNGKLTVNPPSGIEDVNADCNTNSRVFSLSGQRLTSPKKGINIIGRKKVIVK